MANLPTVFISYNPDSEVEQTLAIRLHTIGAVHGFNMLLPDRSFNSNLVSLETRNRIMLADFFILFSTKPMSRVVAEEIGIAYSKLQDKSRILVVYDQNVGANLSAENQHTPVFINTHEDPLKIVTAITTTLKSVQTKKQGNEGLLSSLGGILLVGLGLFALNELFAEEEKPRRRKPAKRKSVNKKKA